MNDFLENDLNHIKDIITLFIETTPEVLKSTERSNDTDDTIFLKEELHKIKSSLSLMGIAKGLEIATRIENEINKNPTSLIWKHEVSGFILICQRAIDELIAIDTIS